MINAAGHRASIVVGLVLLSCARPMVQTAVPPEQLARQVWERLERTGSFAFRLRYQTDSPFGLEADFQGVWQAPSRESWTGTWRRQDAASPVRIVADGDRQYDMTRTGWNRSPRGPEAQLFEQLRATVPAGSAVLRRESAGVCLFEFPASAPVIDPARAKSLTGVLAVRRSTGLPVFVWCHESAGPAYWRVSFSRIGSAGEVHVPFAAGLSVRAVPQRRLSCLEHRRAVATITGRLRRAGWAYRIRRSGPVLRLELEEARLGRALDLLLSVGRVELWGVEPAQVPAGDSVRMVAGDAARRVVLRRLLGDNGSLRVHPDLSLPFAPVLRVALAGPDSMTPDRAGATRAVALLVNSEAADLGTLGPDGQASFSEVGSPELLAAIVGLCAGPELPVGYDVRESD